MTAGSRPCSPAKSVQCAVISLHNWLVFGTNNGGSRVDELRLVAEVNREYRAIEIKEDCWAINYRHWGLFTTPTTCLVWMVAKSFELARFLDIKSGEMVRIQQSMTVSTLHRQLSSHRSDGKWQPNTRFVRYLLPVRYRSSRPVSHGNSCGRGRV
jgi:hypothetical protein